MAINQYTVSSFYKYADIKNPPELQKNILELCQSLKLKGRILLGNEGINGSVYGESGNMHEFERELRKNAAFSDMDFKEQEAGKPAFRKLFVRVRKEIVNSGLKIDLKNTAPFIAPKELKEMLDNNEYVALVDVRNGYESKIGRFRNAMALNTSTFRDLPHAIKGIDHLKDKKIVAYCTGGIRCEKATAYLRENGFKDVMQLKGGILNYGKEFPDTYWEGKCFVFDDRIAIDINKENKEPLNECAWCGKKSDDYLNCHNIKCDKLFICCDSCRKPHNKSCCEECEKAENRRKEHDFPELTFDNLRAAPSR